MLNLNDSIYDYKDYSIYGDRNHPEFIVSDKDSLSRLITYASFEKQLIDNILQKKKSLYLRFCDGEYLYYSKWFQFMPWLQRILWRDTTCRWEKPDIKMVPKHFEIFEKHKDHIYFCPHVSDSRIKQYAWSKLCDYIKKKNLSIYHFYYVYHFLNQLRQKKIKELKNITIALVAHKDVYIHWMDHYVTGRTYTNEIGTMLKNTDFSKYDLVLVWAWVSAPLYMDSISAHCPVIDAWYLINFRDDEWPWERAFSWLYI